jgi:regulator of protease activity HflC (stomatin/prohibitin superfamily)
MTGFLGGGIAGFLAGLIGIPILLALCSAFGLWIAIPERHCVVFELFGKVIGTIDEPGFNVPITKLGLRSVLVPFFGRRKLVDLRMDQTYLRSQPVNSEEGAPMGIGVWYEMFVSDPVSFLYKNSDPQGSLAANVSNATVRCLSNMRLSDMLENRHDMSQTVREEVSAKSQEWGYRLGSVYVRKVHFRDAGMIRQIEEKVVNRLRQVTAAIRQDGSNQVNLITGQAERTAAIEFAKAEAMRPRIIGEALREIAKDSEISDALFEVLEIQAVAQNTDADIAIIPKGADLLAQMTAARLAGSAGPSGPVVPPRR